MRTMTRFVPLYAVLAALTCACAAAAAAPELRAGPWPVMSMDGKNAVSAVVLALSAEETSDMAEAVRQRRLAVAAGDIESAFRLSSLHLPQDGSFGRERFKIQPSFVHGYVWLAIGLAGLTEGPDYSGEWNRAQVEETLLALEKILAPSERRWVAEVLAAWPESLPPESPIRPVDENGPYEDVPEFLEALAGFLNDDAQNDPRRLYRTGGDIHRKAFGELQRLAAAGDDDAAFAAEWCRLFGVGTEQDTGAALPYMLHLAEAGDGRALLALAHDALERDDDVAADGYLLRAAEAGNSHAMLALASRANQQDRKAQRKEWALRAAEAGNVEAVMELVSIAETGQDLPAMLQWLATYALAREGTASGYRARVLMAALAGEAEDGAVRAALEAAERWAVDHGFAVTGHS